MKHIYLIGGLVLTLAVTGSAQAFFNHVKDCQEQLANNPYRCTVIEEGAPTVSYEICTTFNQVAPVRGDFSVRIRRGTTLGCSCATDKPWDFKDSDRFLCVGPEVDDGNPSPAVTVTGKTVLKGKGILDGQIVFEDGESAIYACKIDPTCTVAP